MSDPATLLALAQTLHTHLTQTLAPASSSQTPSPNTLIHPLSLPPSAPTKEILHFVTSSLRSACIGVRESLGAQGEGVRKKTERDLVLLKEMAGSEGVLRSQLGDIHDAHTLLKKRDEYVIRYPPPELDTPSSSPAQNTVKLIEKIATNLGYISFPEESTLSLGAKVMVIDLEIDSSFGRVGRVKMDYIIGEVSREAPWIASMLAECLVGVEDKSQERQDKLARFSRILGQLKELDGWSEQAKRDCFLFLHYMSKSLPSSISLDVYPQIEFSYSAYATLVGVGSFNPTTRIEHVHSVIIKPLKPDLLLDGQAEFEGDYEGDCTSAPLFKAVISKAVLISAKTGDAILSAVGCVMEPCESKSQVSETTSYADLILSPRKAVDHPVQDYEFNSKYPELDRDIKIRLSPAYKKSKGNFATTIYFTTPKQLALVLSILKNQVMFNELAASVMNASNARLKKEIEEKWKGEGKRAMRTLQKQQILEESYLITVDIDAEEQTIEVESETIDKIVIRVRDGSIEVDINGSANQNAQQMLNTCRDVVLLLRWLLNRL